MIIDLQIRAKVDRLFARIEAQSGTFVCNPVTGSDYVHGVDPIGPQKKTAYEALAARQWFAKTGPRDAPRLPLSRASRERRKSGGLPHIVAWFAESLKRMNYDYADHPPFVDYARGVMASPLAPDFVKLDADLLRRFPPRGLDGLGPGLVWQPS